jgi:uncharacterized protein
MLMAEAEHVQQWVLITARMMVGHPDDVKVELIRSDERIALRLYVHPSDVGKIIGKAGRTGRALRTIGGAITQRSGKWFTLDIVDDDKLAVV